MNVIKRKLNSRRGASITWALLVFMVCAVVGSVVLVAGTAAAGRMSRLAENDRRYYAVTSAAGFLRDVFSQKVTAERTARYSVDGSDTVASYTIAFAFKNEDGTDAPADDVLKELIKYLMDWKEPEENPSDPVSSDSVSDASLFWENKDSIKPQDDKELTMALTSGEPEISALLTTDTNEKSRITLSELKLDDNGAFEITVSSADGYSLLLNFDLVHTYAFSETPSENTLKKTDTFQWILKEAKKTEMKDRQNEEIEGG